MDSLCRGYYIPPLVLRQVRMTPDTIKLEVIDGQQRISTIQDFYENELKLPNTLNTLSRGNLMVGKTYEKLEVEQKQWFDKIVLEVDIIKNIEDKANPNHLRKASNIF